MNFANQVLDRCESTNDLARNLGEQGAAHGTWVSARRQEKGRGRLGRQWTSLEGNLFLSVVVRLQPASLWSWVPLAAAIAVASALRERGHDVRIKWPNDLWLGRAKLGGILCEGIGSREDSFIVIGIGLNARVAPEGLDQATVALGENADELRPLVLTSLLAWLEELRAKGTAPLARAYENWAALPPGTSLEWGSGERGDVIALGPSGELRVRLEGGAERPLFAEDVKLRLPRP